MTFNLSAIEAPAQPALLAGYAATGDHRSVRGWLACAGAGHRAACRANAAVEGRARAYRYAASCPPPDRALGRRAGPCCCCESRGGTGSVNCQRTARQSGGLCVRSTASFGRSGTDLRLGSRSAGSCVLRDRGICIVPLCHDDLRQHANPVSRGRCHFRAFGFRQRCAWACETADTHAPERAAKAARTHCHLRR